MTTLPPAHGELLPFLADMPDAELEDVLADLAEEDAHAIWLAEKYAWPNWARPEQLPPVGPWRFWVCVAGRGAGKTRTGAEWVNDIAEVNAGCKIGLIGATKADVRDVMIEDHESGILACARPDFRPHYEPSKRRVTWPNGTIAIVFSADEPEQSRGANLHFVWADELGKWRDPGGAGKITAWENVVLGCRIGITPQLLVTTTPRRTGRGAEIVKELTLGRRLASGRRPVAPLQGDPAEWWPRENTVVRQWSTDRNAATLAVSFLADLDSNYGGTTLEAQERQGRILDDVQGAIFLLEHIEAARVEAVPVLERVLISIDPSHADEGTGDGAGIIAAGLGIDGEVYVLDDGSTRGSPLAWATAGIRLHNQYRADGIVVEVTAVQTERGHAVKDTLRLVDPEVDEAGKPIPRRFKWIEIHASKNKLERAQPVALLYEQGKVHHVSDPRAPDRLAALEDELVSWEPTQRDSPNRLDALVHVVSELVLKRRAPLIAR